MGMYNIHTYLWTTEATIRPPLCLQRRPGQASHRAGRKVHNTVRRRHGRHGRHKVLSVFKTVAHRSPRRLVAHWANQAGWRHTHHRDHRMVAHRSTNSRSRKECVVHHLSIWARLLPPVPRLYRLWSTNNTHWAIIVATTVPPFSDHENLWAIMAMALPPNLPPLSNLLCFYGSLGGSRRNARGLSCTNITFWV